MRAQFDSNGLPLGFYPEHIDYPSIPSGLVAITEEQHLEFLANPHGRRWNGAAVIHYVPPAPAPVAAARVSRRQFFMQLEVAGLTTAVREWVETQPSLVQIAFAQSATFERADTMLQSGFAGLGFTVEQVDAFFTAAAAL